MFFYEGQYCPVCGKPFNETDDVVACPTCGCPHHRGCWMQEGHCHFEADHGTPQQWAQGRTVAPKPSYTNAHVCAHCGTKNPEFAEFCAGCGRELTSSQTPPAKQYTPPANNYTPFSASYNESPFRESYDIPHGETIEGIPVEEIAAMIGPNTAYYLPRFLKMDRNGSKVSWNWAAFLLSYNWLLYRKHILWGILSFLFIQALSFISQFAAYPIQSALDMTSQAAMVQSYYAVMQEPRSQVLVLVMLLTVLIQFIFSILLGMFGNYLYMRHILKKCRRLQDDPSLQYKQGFRSVGGASFALAVSPNLLLTFLAYILQFIGL